MVINYILISILNKSESFEDIVTSIESSDPLPENVHRKRSHQNGNRDTSTCNKHLSCSIFGDPVIEEIREAKKHKILECSSGNESLHGDGSIGIEHIGEAGVHVNKEGTDSETVEDSSDDEALAGIDSETESVKTNTGQDDARNGEEETEFRLRLENSDS